MHSFFRHVDKVLVPKELGGTFEDFKIALMRREKHLAGSAQSYFFELEAYMGRRLVSSDPVTVLLAWECANFASLCLTLRRSPAAILWFDRVEEIVPRLNGSGSPDDKRRLLVAAYSGKAQCYDELNEKRAAQGMRTKVRRILAQ